MSLEYFKKRWEERLNYLLNAKEHLRKVKEFCMKEFDPECRVILFGSVARGNYRIDSDVDVLVITNKVKTAMDRASLLVKIYDVLGTTDPFEIHVVTEKEFKEWYIRFLDVYEEITLQ